MSEDQMICEAYKKTTVHYAIHTVDSGCFFRQSKTNEGTIKVLSINSQYFFLLKGLSTLMLSDNIARLAQTTVAFIFGFPQARVLSVS